LHLEKEIDEDDEENNEILPNSYNSNGTFTGSHAEVSTSVLVGPEEIRKIKTHLNLDLDTKLWKN